MGTEIVRFAEWEDHATDSYRPNPLYWSDLLIVGPILLGLVCFFTESVVCAFAVCIVAHVVYRKFFHARRLPQSDFPKEFDSYESFTVLLVFERSFLPYGEDVGILSFLDGQLVFHGRNCVFSFPRSSIVWRIEERIYFTDTQGRFSFQIHTDRPVAVGRALDRWEESGIPAGNVVVLPPIMPSSAARSTIERHLRVRAVLIVLAGLAAAATAVLGYSLASASFLLIAVSWLLERWTRTDLWKRLNRSD